MRLIDHGRDPLVLLRADSESSSLRCLFASGQPSLTSP
jgi:hypothetical protein